MNEPFEELEAELQSLRPINLSPAVRNQIAQELQEARPTLEPRQTRWARWTGLLIGLAATCLIAGWFLRPEPPAERLTSADSSTLQQPTAAAFDEALPTVWTYRQALIRSPAAAEALLDKHAISRSAVDTTPAHFLTHADRQLLFKGEL
jgi:hypothetical protein